MSAWKNTVRLATTANINLASSVPTIDGVAIAAGNRVLVKDQAEPAQNGIYESSGSPPFHLSRADDSLEAEAVVRVSEGELNSHTAWTLVTRNPIAVETTPLRFVKQNAFFNVRDYGAVGDGVTNDAPAINATIRATADAAPYGGVVYIPPSVDGYNCRSNVDISRQIVHFGRTQQSIEVSI